MCGKCRKEYVAKNKIGQRKIECPVCHRINMKNDKASKSCRECFLKASRSPDKICPSCKGVKSSVSKKCFSCAYERVPKSERSKEQKFCNIDVYYRKLKAKKFCKSCNKELCEKNKKGLCLKCTSGVNHPNWNHNADVKHRQLFRRNFESDKWRLAVYRRDDFECQKCGSRSGKINAHHIFNLARYEAGMVDEDNGVTLCIPCHKAFHKRYGKTNNDLNQLLHFLNTNTSNVGIFTNN